jgi:cell division septation protein DedD
VIHCNKWDIELKIFSKNWVLLIGVLWLLAGVPQVFAFSVGGFQIQSKFGGKFKASFQIDLDFDGPVKVALGDVNDYRKLGLDRQDIMDALIMDPIEASKELKKIVQIHSNKPLFFPSFNLVVRATHNGGTLLESFLVTVDFQQNLALNVQRKKKSIPKSPKVKSSLKRRADKTPPQSSSESQQLDKEVSGSSKELGVAAEDSSRISESTSLNEESEVVSRIASEEAGVSPLKGITPVSAKPQVVHRRRASGVIWAYPRSIPELRPESSVDKNVAKVKTSPPLAQNTETAKLAETRSPDTLPVLPSSNEGYVLQKGEGLFSVARKLKIAKYHPAQIAVAIWMQNIDKFIFGNINGIQQGVQLDIKNLEDSFSSIDLATARRILKSQTVEWNLAKSIGRVNAEKQDRAILEIPLPAERLPDPADLFEQVIGWQTTWENMDIERHLAYYQKLKAENPFQSRKKRFLFRHPKPNLETSSKMLVFNEGVPLVFFEQDFSSETLKSRGLKELEWTRSQTVWKIRGEKFYEKPLRLAQDSLASQEGGDASVNEEKILKLSFVIHVSSHAKESLAVSLTNRLRENGFDAYWVPVRISKGVQIYRVYVGRFSDWNQAHRVVKVLRKKPFGGHATAIPYPFSLQVGEFNSLTEAKILLESLRKSGLSGLLLVSHKEPAGVLFRVVVGAFKKADNSTWMLRQLRQSGFVGKLISP